MGNRINEHKSKQKKRDFLYFIKYRNYEKFLCGSFIIFFFDFFVYLYIPFFVCFIFFNLHLAKSIMNECFVCVLFLLCFSFFFSFKFFCLCEKLFNEAYRELNFYEETKQNKRKKNCNRYVEESIEVVKIFLYVECRKCLI